MRRRWPWEQAEAGGIYRPRLRPQPSDLEKPPSTMRQPLPVRIRYGCHAEAPPVFRVPAQWGRAGIGPRVSDRVPCERAPSCLSAPAKRGEKPRGGTVGGAAADQA
jgi:hypothetical protein